MSDSGEPQVVVVPNADKGRRGARRVERFLRPGLRALRWCVRGPLLAMAHPDALAFYRAVEKQAFLPNDLIDVVPSLNLLYLAVPKAASSRIRGSLAAMIGRDTVSDWRSDANWKVHKRKSSGLSAPRHGIVQFHRLATDPSALRFTFVRNPYARLVSCWADQYADRPLVPGYGRVELYLEHRARVNPKLPFGAGKSLSFAEFVEFACGSMTWRIDRHWQLQSDIIDLPGMELNMIGKVENFTSDFGRVLDHVGADKAMRQATVKPLHTSSRRRICDYFTPELAALVYRSYERDFDRLGYSRALPS
jgi:hypothetical protein